jgi:hypothetical protein
MVAEICDGAALMVASKKPWKNMFYLAKDSE